MKYYAVGSQAVWDSYTQEQKNFYENNHFLKYSDAILSVPLDNIDDYKLLGISDSIIDSQIIVPVLNNSNKIILDSNGYVISSTISVSDFNESSITPAEIVFDNFNIIFTVAKNYHYDCFYWSRGCCNLTVSNCIINVNNLKGNGITYSDDNDGVTVNIYNNIIINSANYLTNNSYGGINIYNNSPIKNNTLNIWNNTILNASEAINVFGSNENVNIYNNYAHSRSVSHSAIDGSYVGGNNVTSDSSGEITNVSMYDALVDPDNENFTPKEILKNGSAPIIEGHTHYKNGVLIKSPYYVGAIGAVTQKNKKNKSFGYTNTTLHKNGIF